MPAVSSTDSERLNTGFLWGTLGVLAFSMTLPATRVAVSDLDGVIVGLGRTLVAAVLAAMLLVWKRDPFPQRRYWPGLLIVSLTVVAGFSVLSGVAMQYVPASHAAVIIGLAPATTALMAVWRGNERPRPAFWAGCAMGVIAVLVFAVAEGAGQPQPADLLLLLAVVLVSLGYAEGARLSREMGGGWRVLCWALVVSAPVLAIPVGFAVSRHGLQAGPLAWSGFIYLSVCSMFLGMLAWYRGLALGGAARVGQLQLLQPVLTLLWSGLLLREEIRLGTVAAALFVVASVAVVTILGRPAPGLLSDSLRPNGLRLEEESIAEDCDPTTSCHPCG